MPRARPAPSPRAQRPWFLPALLALGLLTGARLIALALTPMDLFVDEAQYWLWGQDLAFGYYSKPPMIAWVIRLSTEIGGSDSAFWIRAPGPVLHLVTALILGAIAARLAPGGRAALWVALAYGSLPLVAVGSVLIATDTVLFPFLAGALWAWITALQRQHDPRFARWARLWPAALAGALLGLGLMSKYAAIYGPLGAGLAAAFLPGARPGARQVLVALAALALVIAPNLAWNAANGFSTFEHTLDNAEWVREDNPVAWSLAGGVEFFLSQFAVFGPVLMGGLVVLSWQLWRGRGAEAGAGAGGRGPDRLGFLMCFIWPAIAIVTAQGILSKAYANWAATAYLAASLAVVPWLLARGQRAWLALSFAINLGLCLALIALLPFADRASLGGRLILGRYIGQEALSQAIIAQAKAQGLTLVAAENRDVLADLFHTGRDSGLTFRALPATGRAAHHYQLKFPLEPGLAGDLLYVAQGSGPAPACAPDVPAPDAPALAQIAPDRGAWAGKQFTLFRLPANCWQRP